MDLYDLPKLIAEKYGLVPVYALIITAGAIQASSVRQLLTALAIMAGVYAVMFKAFDLGRGFDVFGLAARFGPSADVANGIAAGVFVFGLGFLVYGAKRLVVRRPAT
jgi:hypothetical protein